MFKKLNHLVMKSLTGKHVARILLAVSFAGMFPMAVVAQANNLTKEKIEAALNAAYDQFKNLKEARMRLY
jgi:uncharacterized protein (DUF433 family)